MLEDCDRTHNTIAVMNYIGDDFEDGTSAIASVDYEALSALLEIKQWQPVERQMATVDGFVQFNSTQPYRYRAVLVVSGIRPVDENGLYYAIVEADLYSFRLHERGGHIYFYLGQTDFVPDFDKMYVVHGEYLSPSIPMLSLMVREFTSVAATEIGKLERYQIWPYREVLNFDAYMSKTNDVFFKIADYYDVMNRAVPVYRTADLTNDFLFHQGILKLEQGRTFTPEEIESEAKVCVVSQTYSDRMGVEVGDTIDIRLIEFNELPSDDCYWQNYDGEPETYTIIGKVNYTPDYQYNIYIPAPVSTVQPKGSMEIGQALLYNGTADAFYEEAKELLPPRIALNIYDQGYQEKANAITAIYRASIVLTAVGVVACIAVLVLFAYMFIYRQRQTIQIMGFLGTSKPAIRAYLFVGSGLITVVASAIGGVIGDKYASRLLMFAYNYVLGQQVTDYRYSAANSGLMAEFNPVAKSSWQLAVIIAVAVFVLTVVLCQYFMVKAAQIRKIKTVSVFKRGWRLFTSSMKFSLRSMRRSLLRSMMVSVVAIAMVLMMAVLTLSQASYKQSLEKLKSETVISGAITSMNGKTKDGVVVDKQHANALFNSGYLDKFAVTIRAHFMYGDVKFRGERYNVDFKPITIPSDPYAYEKLVYEVFMEPYLVFTNQVEAVPEFEFSDPDFKFMEGYDLERFNNYEKNLDTEHQKVSENKYDMFTGESLYSNTSEADYIRLVCVAPVDWLEERGIELGDTIGGIYWFDNLWHVSIKVVGSFVSASNRPTLYTVLPAGFPLDSEDPILEMYTPVMARMITMLNYSSVSFTIKDAHKLDEFKAFAADYGFSEVQQIHSVNNAMLLYDKEYLAEVNNFNQRIRYMEILSPTLQVLVVLLGFLVAFLMLNSRKNDFAIMQSLGATRMRVFLSFFFEQLILIVFGTALAVGLWIWLVPQSPPPEHSWFFYMISYLFGTIVSIIVINSTAVLRLTRERE